ncbi:MAG TPA: PAS domain S-box protein [Bacteroidota bacterium]|nr:PAS domain S-box protein [Bacteroidota bacterium]
MADRGRRGTRRRRTAPARGRGAGAAARSPRATLHTFAEELPGMIWVVDTKGGMTYANTRLCTFAGTTMTSVLGDKWQVLVHQDDRAEAAAAVNAAVRARQPFTIECRMRNRDGDYRWVTVAGNPRTSNGRYAGFIGTVTDSTPRRSAEHAAGLASSRLHVLVAAMDDMCVGVGKEEEIIFWNRKAEQFTGIPATETIGHSLQTVLSPETLANVRTLIRAPHASGGSSLVESCVFYARPDLPVRAQVVTSDNACILVAFPERDGQSPSGGSVVSALAAQNDWLHNLLQNTEDIVIIQDAEGRYLYSNGSHRFGIRTEDVLGKLPGEIHDRDSTEIIMRRVRRVIQSGDGFTEETRMSWEGQSHWFLDQLSPLRNAAGTVAAVATISRNITDRKEAEQRLQDSEERYRTFVENSNEGIWRIETDEPIPVGLPVDEQVHRVLKHAYIAECNASLARLFGFEQAQAVIGVRFDELPHAETPEDLRTLTQFIQSGYRLMNYETQLRRQDGLSRYVLHNVVGTVENGQLVRAWGSLSDVTERKDAERELRLLAHTITSTRDCVSLTDLDDRVLFVNDAFLSTYGFSEEELIGHDIKRVRPEGNEQAGLGAIKEKTLDGGWYGEVINRRADGSLFPVELWTSVVRNDEGEPVAMVGVARDITARKQAEEELRASLREKEVLLKEIHHRVKNNLQVISSLLSLQSEYLKDEEMIKIFKESQNRVKSMALIHEKLYQSRNLAEIDFGDYLRELTTQLVRSYGIGTHGVQLNVNTSRVLLAVDRAIPCGIIVNELVTNALKYAFPDGRSGRIDVDLHPVSTDRVRLTVRDNGVGIPDHIDVTTSDSLGLTLVRMLGEQVQGEMAMQPHGPGTEFMLTFRK